MIKFKYSLGPVGLTKNSVSNADTVPTVLDNLHSQNNIDNVLGVYFEPSTKASKAGAGELSFGGPDKRRVVGNIKYVPITGVSPANEFWGIDQDITYGSQTNILTKASGIVDTGIFVACLQMMHRLNEMNCNRNHVDAARDRCVEYLVAFCPTHPFPIGRCVRRVPECNRWCTRPKNWPLEDIDGPIQSTQASQLQHRRQYLLSKS